MRKRVLIGTPVALVTMVASSSLVPAASDEPDSSASSPATSCARQWFPWPAARDAEAFRATQRTPAAPTPVRGAAQRARSPQTSDSQQRPNIVTIMVDDMRADELSGPWMKHTRQLIADQGVRFANSFSPLPLCGPARASFLTGKYPHNTGVRQNVDPTSMRRLNDTNTLPVWLQRSGYTTAHIGKYLNGYGSPVAPKPGQYVPPGWDRWYASIGPSTYRYFGTQLSANGAGRLDLSGRYQTAAYGDLGSRTLGRLAAKQRPFYVNVSFSAPHNGWPREPDDPSDLATVARPPALRGAYNDRITTAKGVPGGACEENKPGEVSQRQPLSPLRQAGAVTLARQRAEALASVDDSVHQLIETLRRSGELDNTYIVFTSDNGYFLGEHRQQSRKRLTYDAALRTPTVIRGPGINPGITRRSPFATIDFAPTIADMAGARVRGTVDGVSKLPSATGPDRGRTRPVFTDMGEWAGQRWRSLGVRTERFAYRYTPGADVDEELYDVRSDPHELRNLADHPGFQLLRREMWQTAQRLRDCSGAQCRR